MKLRLKIDDQTFEVEVGDLSARPITASVDGETFEIWPEEVEVITAPVAAAPKPATPAAPRPVRTPAASAAPVDKSLSITAPIPGTIISISIKDGDEVKPGQEICILEAMKMKNAIRAPRAGKIAAIRVAPGDLVRHGQALMDYAE